MYSTGHIPLLFPFPYNPRLVDIPSRPSDLLSRATEISLQPINSEISIEYYGKTPMETEGMRLPVKHPRDALETASTCLIISTLHRLYFNTANNIVQTSVLKTGALQCMLEFLVISPHRPRSFFSRTLWAFRLYLYEPPITSKISSISCWVLRPEARTRSDRDNAIDLYSFHSTRKSSIEGTLQSLSNKRVGNRKLSIEDASEIVQ